MNKYREYTARSPERGFSSNRRVKERSPELMREVVNRTAMPNDGHPLVMRDAVTRDRVQVDSFEESRGERHSVIIRDRATRDETRIDPFDRSRWVMRDRVIEDGFDGSRGERHSVVMTDGVTRDGRGDGFSSTRGERHPVMMTDGVTRDGRGGGFSGTREERHPVIMRDGVARDGRGDGFSGTREERHPVIMREERQATRRSPPVMADRRVRERSPEESFNGGRVRNTFGDPKSRLDPHPLDGDCEYTDTRRQVSASLLFPTEVGRNGERGTKRNLSQERGRSLSYEYRRPPEVDPMRRTGFEVELPFISGGRPPENVALPINGSQLVDSGFERFSQSRIRSPSAKRRKLSGVVEDYDMGEVFHLNHGGPGQIHSYLTEKTGLISCPNGDLAFFHIDQIWYKHPTIGYCKFLEIFSIDEVKRRFGVNYHVNFNARDARCQRSDIKYQVTAIWSEGSVLGPADYRSHQVSIELDTKLAEFCNPGGQKRRLGGPSDELHEARVHEYFSHEMGLLKLVKGDLGVILFHLNQVWVERHHDWVPLRNVQDQVMEILDLPLGTKVMVKTRPIPAHRFSQLLYQAVAVWKVPERSKIPSLLSELNSSENSVIYSTPDKHKVEEGVMYAELDRYHDVFKKLCKFERAVSASDFNPVPAVVNGLPARWEAIVVAGLNHEFGVIRITHRDKGDLTREEDGFHVPEVRQLYAVFHLEDVYSVDGDSSYKCEGLTMSTLVNCSVDLTARSICGEETPKKILELQRGLPPDHQAVPVLQAVVVCVKPHPNASARTSNIPKPTCLRLEPGSFDPKYSTFYVNLLLRFRLDTKVHDFLRIPSKLNLPYDQIIKPTLPKEHKVREKLDNLKVVDVNRTSEKHYGRFNPKYKQLDHSSLPMSLHNVKAKIRLLHRNGIKSTCGLLEVPISDGKSYVFFDHSDYKFFSGYDCHASDLANIMPVCNTDKFCVNAVLVNSRSKEVPYLATCVWNEHLRKDLGAPIPPETIAANAVEEKSNIIDEIITEWMDEYAHKPLVYQHQKKSEGRQLKTSPNTNFIPKISRNDHDNPKNHSTFSFKSDDKDYLLEQKRKISSSASSRPHSRGKEDLRMESTKFTQNKDPSKFTNVKDSLKFTQNKDSSKFTQKKDSSKCKDSAWFHFRVPHNAGTTQSARDFPLDERNVCVKDSKLVEYFGNCDGVVEKVLSQHYAIINYQNTNNERTKKSIKDKKPIRILLTSNDLFMETDTFENVINAKEKKMTMPLDKQLFPGDKVKFNAVMLASPEPNPSGINYYCTAAIYGYDCNKHFVPVLPFLSCKLTASDDWKNQFANVVACLSKNLVPEEKQKWLLSVPPLEAHKIDQFRECPPTLEGKKIISLKAKRILGPPSEHGCLIENVLKLPRHVDQRKTYEKPPKILSKKVETPKIISKKVESPKIITKKVVSPKTVSKNVEESDGNGILYANDKIVEFLTNAEGTVEKLLGQHYGLIKYLGKGENGKYTIVRILFTSRNMVGNQNNNIARPKVVPLLHCSTGDKLVFNAALLRPLTKHNEARINYYCTGAVKQGENQTKQKYVPWLPIKTSNSTENDYIKRYTEIVTGLSLNLKMSPGLQKNVKSWTDVPESHDNSVWQKCPVELRGLKVLGGEGLLNQFENGNDKVEKQEKVQVKLEPIHEEDCPVYLNRKGRVIKIINENYGILAGAVGQDKAKRVYQVIFDVHDVYIGDKTLKDIGKTLKDVMKVGDDVKFNGVHLKDMAKEEKRCIQDLATSLVIAKNASFDSVRFPATMVPIQEMDQIQEEKLKNFKVVAKAVGGMELTAAENKLLASLEMEHL